MRILLLFAASTLVSNAFAMVELKDSELSNVTGQAVLQMNKEVANGFTFYKAGLDAVLEINTNIEKLQLGCGGINQANTPGCDLDIDRFSLGCVADANGNCVTHDPVGNQKPGAIPDTPANRQQLEDFTITRPYFQFAIKNDDSKTLREVVGVRLGGEDVNGPMSFGSLNQFSGYMTGNAQLTLQGQGHEDHDPSHDGADGVAVTCGPSGAPCPDNDGVNAFGYEGPEYSLGLDNAEACVGFWPLEICEEFKNLSVSFDGISRDSPVTVSGNRETQALIANLDLGRRRDGDGNPLGAVAQIADSLGFVQSNGLPTWAIDLVKGIIQGQVEEEIVGQLAAGLNTSVASLDNNTYELPYNLNNVHQLDVSSSLFGLSFQKESVQYPGYSNAVSQGWALYTPEAFTLDINDKTTVLVNNIAGNSNARDGNIVGLEAPYRNCWGDARFC